MFRTHPHYLHLSLWENSPRTMRGLQECKDSKCDSAVFFGVGEGLTDPRGRVASGVGLRLLACWDCGFESCSGHGCLYFVRIVCFQVEVSASDRSVFQRRPTECGASECDREASVMRMPWAI